MKKTFAGKDLELVARYDPKEFGRLLRSLRERAGKTQANVGRKAGVVQTYVSMIEGGKRDPKRIKPVRLLRLLEAYGVPKEEALALIEAWSLSSEAPLPSPAPGRPPQEARPLVLPLLEEEAGEVLPDEAKGTVALYLPALEKEASFLAVRAHRVRGGAGVRGFPPDSAAVCGSWTPPRHPAGAAGFHPRGGPPGAPRG